MKYVFRASFWARFFGKLIPNTRKKSPCILTRVTAFIEDTKTTPLDKLAERERLIRGSQYQEPNLKYSSLQLKSDRTPFLLWFDLFSRNGYRREKVLRNTDEAAPSAFLLAILFRRLNDWVPQVRMAATHAVKRVIAKTPPLIVAEALWATFPDLEKWTRNIEVAQLLNETALRRPDIQDALSEKLISATSGPAAKVLQQFSRSSSVDRHLLNMASQAIQPAVRAAAYRILLSEQAKWVTHWKWQWVDKIFGEKRRAAVFETRPISINVDLLSVLAAAAIDPSPIVRRVAGDSLIARQHLFGEDTRKIAISLSKDNYPSIAERGRFVLKNEAN